MPKPPKTAGAPAAACMQEYSISLACMPWSAHAVAVERSSARKMPGATEQVQEKQQRRALREQLPQRLGLDGDGQVADEDGALLPLRFLLWRPL